MHPELIPPDALKGYDEEEVAEWKTEFDVVKALKTLGHEVLKLGISDELRPLREAANDWKPDIVFNLLEEFRGEAIFDQNVVGYLELLGLPYTGCNAQGMVLSRGKALSKKIVTYHRVPVPRFVVFHLGRKVRPSRNLRYPLIVKSVNEDASLGISQASVVWDAEALVERAQFVHERIGSHAIAEQFIEGRDVYVPVLGNDRLRVFPAQELVFQKKPDDSMNIATEKAKFDLRYQKKWGIDLKPAELDPALANRLGRLTKRVYRALQLDGYARVDYRLDGEGNPYFVEANANPDVAREEEFASSAAMSGLKYEKLIQTILTLGLRRHQERWPSGKSE
jgi:D-alanine-D-alanine ligase